MKKLIYLFLLLILTAFPSGEEFNPGSVDDGVELPEDTTDTTDDVIEVPTDVPKDTIVKPEKPVKEYILKEAFSGAPKEIPANNKNSLVSNSKDQPFTLRAYLNIKDKTSLQWIASKRDKENNEWQLMIYQDQLVFALTEEGDYKPNSIARALPLSELPTGDFLLHIEYDGNYSTSGFTWTVNGREVETNHLWDSTYKGMTKSNASVFIGKAGFNDNYPFKGTAEISISKGLSTPEKKLNDYKETFGLESVFAKPSKNGNYYIDVEPNTGEDVSIALNKAIENIPDGKPGNYSKIILKAGSYNVNRNHLPVTVKRGSIDLYARKYLSFNSDGEEPVVLYFDDTEIDTKLETQRNQLRAIKSKGLRFNNIHTKGTNNKKSYKSHLEDEHGLAFIECENIDIENYVGTGNWGDGLYFKKTNNIDLKKIETTYTNRQGIAFVDGCQNIVVDGHLADFMTRAAIDFEPDSGGVVNNIEIKNGTWKDGHLASGGVGKVNNLYIHDMKHRAPISVRGGLSYPRYGLRIEDNESIGGFGSPVGFYHIAVQESPKLIGNKSNISTRQGRIAAIFDVCGGTIEIKDNDFTNPSIVMVNYASEALKELCRSENSPYDIDWIQEDPDVIFEGNTPGSVLVIKRNNKVIEVRGENPDPELLKIIESYE